MSAANRRVVVVINKNWEADPALAALTSLKARPPRLTKPTVYNAVFPADPAAPPTPPVAMPRAVFSLTGKSGAAVDAEIWCLEDVMDLTPRPAGTKTPGSSSSSEKARVLPGIFAYGTQWPDFVIAVGTAGYPDTGSINGSVVIGSDVFVHDPYVGTTIPGSDGWTHPDIGSLLSSSRGTSLIRSTFGGEAKSRIGLRAEIEVRLLPTPMNPAAQRLVMASANMVAVSVVNVNNYDHYTWTDPSGMAAFYSATIPRRPAGSVETTHGVIRITSAPPGSAHDNDVPFVYVSGITDRLGYFDAEVGVREYAQNFAAAHNAGVATAWLLPHVADAL